LSKTITIAIDGPAGSGKSTLARRLAEKLGFLYIDTGAMYRAVALWARRTGVASSDMHRLEQLALAARIEFGPDSRILLNGEDVTDAIRTPDVSDAASEVSKVPGVRRALVEKQRELGSGASVVMEGRDIGTVVFPGAKVKIFLDARPEARAQRRAREDGISPDAIAPRLEQRDTRDRSRADSPLVQAPDAAYVDTTGLSVEEVEEILLKIVRDRTSNGKERTH
jgi:cytidylate kinase